MVQSQPFFVSFHLSFDFSLFALPPALQATALTFDKLDTCPSGQPSSRKRSSSAEASLNLSRLTGSLFRPASIAF